MLQSLISSEFLVEGKISLHSEKLDSKDLLMILAATFFYMCSSMLVTPLIASFAKNISGSNVLAGFIAGLTNLVSLGLRPLAGSFSDRFSKYALAFFGGTFLLLANLGYALAATTWQLILFRVLNGVGYVFSSVCMASWMVALLPRTKIGSGMGLFGLLNALGMALGPAANDSVECNYLLDRSTKIK
jgi:MFS family permease